MFVTLEDRWRVLVFADEVVRHGQNGMMYHTPSPRQKLQMIANTWAGKIVEVELCRFLGIHPDSGIDWTVGLGEAGATADAGWDIAVGSDRVSVNAIAPHCQWLLIPVYKYEKHLRDEVTMLVLGQSLGFDKLWDRDEMVGKMRRCDVTLVGGIRMPDFTTEMARSPMGGEFNLSVDNVGVHKKRMRRIGDGLTLGNVRGKP